MNPGYYTKQDPRFSTIEKIRKLRTAQQIAQLSGESWDRPLPPPPVLPPYGKLIKLSGRLESFGKQSFQEYFSPLAYRTSTLPKVSAGQRGAAAAGAIAIGSPGLAGVLTTERSDSEYRRAEYIQGVINGYPFRGWVGLTRLQAGDEVEIVAEWQENHYEVYAIALPAERIISVCPDCDRGHIAQAWYRVKGVFVIMSLLMFVVMLSQLLGFIFMSDRPVYSAAIYFQVILMGCGISFAMGCAFSFSAYKAFAPTVSKLAEEIFTVMGMEKVASLNLNKTTRQREKQLKQQGLWYSYRETDKPACPSSQFICSMENWFYY